MSSGYGGGALGGDDDERRRLLHLQAAVGYDAAPIPIVRLVSYVNYKTRRDAQISHRLLVFALSSDMTYFIHRPTQL